MITLNGERVYLKGTRVGKLYDGKLFLKKIIRLEDGSIGIPKEIIEVSANILDYYKIILYGNENVASTKSFIYRNGNLVNYKGQEYYFIHKTKLDYIQAAISDAELNENQLNLFGEIKMSKKEEEVLQSKGVSALYLPKQNKIWLVHQEDGDAIYLDVLEIDENLEAGTISFIAQLVIPAVFDNIPLKLKKFILDENKEAEYDKENDKYIIALDDIEFSYDETDSSILTEWESIDKTVFFIGNKRTEKIALLSWEKEGNKHLIYFTNKDDAETAIAMLRAYPPFKDNPFYQNLEVFSSQDIDTRTFDEEVLFKATSWITIVSLLIEGDPKI